MFKQDDLEKAFENTKSFLLRISTGMDTLHFRKSPVIEGFLTEDEIKQVDTFLKDKIKKSDEVYKITKAFIDKSEMSSDFHKRYPKKFRGSYYPVIIKTFAGVMTVLEHETMNGISSSQQV